MSRRSGSRLLLGSVILPIVAVCSLACSIGADGRWLAALGHYITTLHRVPTGVPFAAEATAHWPNALVLGELLFHWLDAALGDRGLMVANVIAVAIAMTILAQDAIDAGATAAGAGAALLIAALGAFPSLVIARNQLFSIALFPILIALLRGEARNPSRRIWLIPPLLAVWANLHGGVLVGLGVAGLYLLSERFWRAPLTAVSVGIAAVVAVCLTPAGVHTVAFYQSVLTNVAAEHGQTGAPPLGSALGALMIGTTVILAFFALREKLTRPAAWELVTIACLAALTLKESRAGVWLLFFLVAPAARGLRPKRTWDLLHIPLVGAALAALVLAVARGPIANGAGASLIARAVKLAHGTPVLAEAVIGEQIAVAGGRVSISDPIEAFSRRDQTIYVDWIEGASSGRRALRSDVRVVVVQRGSAAERLMALTPGFVAIDHDDRAEIYMRVLRRT